MIEAAPDGSRMHNGNGASMTGVVTVLKRNAARKLSLS
jgi:hypothetical protein